MRILALAILVGLAAPARAEFPFGLELPIDCQPGVDCWILRYVDHDPGPGGRDYACGALTGEGHKGTDFALRDLAVMTAGVRVRATADGIVDALRDGMPDISIGQSGPAAVAGRECGNGIRLDHGDGWTSWYCHLRRGSLMVQKGDRVAAGQALALVGLSGETSFPHLHFDLRHGDRIVDPFVGLERTARCGQGDHPLWRAEVLAGLDYAPMLLTNIGFAPAAPKKEDVRRGWHQQDTLSTSSPVLVVWAEAYWLVAGDRVTFRLRAPDGGVLVERAMAVERDQQRWFGFAGVKRRAERWPAGIYRGEVAVERGEPGETRRIAIERAVELR